MPPEIVDRLNREIVELIRTPRVTERIKREGAQPIASSPAEFGARFQNEVAKWARVSREAGLAN